MIILKPNKVLNYGLEFAGHPHSDYSNLAKKRYRSAYGIGPSAVSKVIADLQSGLVKRFSINVSKTLRFLVIDSVLLEDHKNMDLKISWKSMNVSSRLAAF